MLENIPTNQPTLTSQLTTSQPSTLAWLRENTNSNIGTYHL